MRNHITARALRHTIAVAIASSSIGIAVSLAAGPAVAATSAAIHATDTTSPGPDGSGNPWG